MSVKFETADEHGTPMTLVKAAKEKIKNMDPQNAYDDVWCVFDRDDHPHFESAIKEAEDADLLLAVSNPCFELWLYLHFAEQPGPQDRVKLVLGHSDSDQLATAHHDDLFAALLDDALASSASSSIDLVAIASSSTSHESRSRSRQ